MSWPTADQAAGSGSSAVLGQLQSLPQLQLRREPGAVTAVVFHGWTIARLDEIRQSAEIAEPVAATIHLTTPRRVRTAVALIRRAVDEAMYHWQLSTAGP